MAEKQDKVVRKIRSALKQGNEGQLGAKKNDECYTDAQDIINELSYWAELGKFRGKSIICPCDWDIADDENIYGITITYKDEGVEVVGNNVYKAVKVVVVSLWEDTDDGVQVTQIDLAEDEIEDFLRNKLTCNFVRTLTQNARRWGIKSITASGYNPANRKGTPFQDIDYSKYDVCITNPPFSLYGKFMSTIVGKIDFVVLAPFLNRATPCVGLNLMLKRAYLGKGIGLTLTFDNPTKENNYSGTKLVGCDWITSWPEAQNERNALHFKSGVRYEDYKDEFVEMPNMVMKDGTCPIRVGGSTYPEDYDGWMFASVNVLNYLDQETYEWYCTNCQGYYNADIANNPFKNKATDGCLVKSDGKKGFHGIVFRKKKKEGR